MENLELLPYIFGGISIAASIVAGILTYIAAKKDDINVKVENVDDDTLNLLSSMRNLSDL